ncbi:MAG: hypothetical protein DMG64_00525 [Acidobacteria bacterium]|nr:MAG: hypothetical protein DMG64_00525 [Acidobacteriota bacterium]PYY22720.1 MAG: hypothetical protein DMG62_11950 [Acidobacteriota bacterium]
MRNAFLLLALLLTISCFALPQANAGQQGTAPTPGTAPAAHDPAQPQNQMPPDTKAPPPTSTPSTSPGQFPSNPAAAHYISPGTTIRANLDTPLSTRTSQVGDRFTATITAPVQDSGGNIIIPVGAKLNGQITEPPDEKLASAIKGMGHLNLRFTNIQLASGADIPINATLLSVHKPQLMRPSADGGSQPGSTSIGANTAANTALSRAFGPPMKGVAVGNLSGGGYVLSTSGKQVDLPADCGLRLRVDRDTPLP